jgi:hypothetical protein
MTLTIRKGTLHDRRTGARTEPLQTLHHWCLLRGGALLDCLGNSPWRVMAALPSGTGL